MAMGGSGREGGAYGRLEYERRVYVRSGELGYWKAKDTSKFKIPEEQR